MSKKARLHNQKVKINVNKILNNKHMKNEMFLDFVKKHKNQILIAKQDYKTPYLYHFEEDKRWLFDENFLIPIQSQ